MLVCASVDWSLFVFMLFFLSEGDRVFLRYTTFSHSHLEAWLQLVRCTMGLLLHITIAFGRQIFQKNWSFSTNFVKFGNCLHIG